MIKVDDIAKESNYPDARALHEVYLELIAVIPLPLRDVDRKVSLSGNKR